MSPGRAPRRTSTAPRRGRLALHRHLRVLLCLHECCVVAVLAVVVARYLAHMLAVLVAVLAGDVTHVLAVVVALALLAGVTEVAVAPVGKVGAQLALVAPELAHV